MCLLNSHINAKENIGTEPIGNTIRTSTEILYLPLLSYKHDEEPNLNKYSISEPKSF